MGIRFNRGDMKGVLHYITINVRDKATIFSHSQFALIVLQELSRRCRRQQAKLVAYVIMPDHIHIIINIRDGTVSIFLAQFKQAVTRRINEQMHVDENDKHLSWLNKSGHPELWQDGKHDFYIYSPEMLKQKIDYIHANPVRDCLVEHAQDYKYSSFCASYEGYGEPIIPVDKEYWWDNEEAEM